MARHILSARTREKTGKEAAKKLRRDNQIPAIFYGPGTAQIMLTVDYSDLKKILRQTAGENIILGLQIESDKGTDSKMVMLKELQSDPIKDTYLHADFYEVSMDKEITIDIPIRLINIPKGVTDGGILQHVRREITISCLPDKLVEYIEVDVSELDIGDSIHIEDLVLPEGIETDQETGLTIANVMAPSIQEEEVEEIEEGEEGEEGEAKEGEEEEAGAEKQESEQ